MLEINESQNLYFSFWIEEEHTSVTFFVVSTYTTFELITSYPCCTNNFEHKLRAYHLSHHTQHFKRIKELNPHTHTLKKKTLIPPSIAEARKVNLSKVPTARGAHGIQLLSFGLSNLYLSFPHFYKPLFSKNDPWPLPLRIT